MDVRYTAGSCLPAKTNNVAAIEQRKVAKRLRVEKRRAKNKAARKMKQKQR
jgi:hypothetical protein